MSGAPAISDDYTVTSKMLQEASGLCGVSLWRHQRHGNLAKPLRRPGARGKWWKPSQANQFLRRIGKPQVFQMSRLAR